jgi:uncharacterized membrane protein
MATITREVEIAAPVGAVWALLEDVRRLPEFSTSTLEVDDAPDRITAVGQTYTQVGKLLGRRYRSQWRITALVPEQQIRSEGSVGLGVSYCLTQNIQPVGDDRTRLQIVIDYTLPGGPLGRLASKAGVESRAGSEAQAVLDGVRRVVERSG